jgi:O-methyltransferase
MESLFRIIRRSKAWYTILQLDRITPGHVLRFIGHMSLLSKWIRDNKKAGRNDFYTARFDYGKRYDLYRYVIDKQELNTEIDYIEFGVSQGHSFRWWVENISHPQARFYGFDTFTGLPEAWGPFKKGDMGTLNEIPRIEGDERHQFFQGLFQQTLLPFLSTYKKGRRKVVHMDADIYSATLYVLTLITPYLEKGDIILFDEFNVPMHEFKAFREWTNSFYINYEVLGSVNNFYQLALIIK